jgi:hypothetical protein
MINKAILVGRLGKDPEVRYTPDGMMITNFTLATDEQRKDKNGEKIKHDRVAPDCYLRETCRDLRQVPCQGKAGLCGGAHSDAVLGRQGRGQTLHDRNHCLGHADARLERSARRRRIVGRTADLPFRGGCPSLRGGRSFLDDFRTSFRWTSSRRPV